MTLRPRDRIAVAVVLTALVVGAFYLLVLKPQHQKAAALDASIAAQRQTLSEEQQSYQAGRAAQAQIRARAAEWAALRIAVPAQSDIPGLLRILERNASAVHVKMQSIQLAGASGSSATAATPTSTPASPSPTPPTAPVGSASGGSAGSSPAAGSSVPSASAATGVPVALTFAGGYRALDALVHRLDGLVVLSRDGVHATGPLMSIGNVSLSGSSDLTVQLSATIYQLPAASSAAGATTGGQS